MSRNRVETPVGVYDNDIESQEKLYDSVIMIHNKRPGSLRAEATMQTFRRPAINFKCKETMMTEPDRLMCYRAHPFKYSKATVEERVTSTHSPS